MVVPNSVLRVILAIGALLAALLVAGSGIGIAAADPDASDPPDTSSDPPNDSQSEPAADPAPAPEVPKTGVGTVQDVPPRPTSIFGIGLAPTEQPSPVDTDPDDASPTPTRKQSHGKPSTRPDPPDVKPKPDPVADHPNMIVPQPKWSSALNVVLPFSPPVVIPFPTIPVRGYENLQLTVDLTDPDRALASVQETTNTINSLLVDAFAPYNPFPPPTPVPRPTFKILEEEPVVEASGGSGGSGASGGSSGDLPVLQAPPMAPPVRVALPHPMTLPRPISGTTPAGSGGRVADAGTAGVRGSAPAASPAQPASTPQGAYAPVNSAMGGSGQRLGYQQYLRSARSDQVATIAVPGLIGLLAVTASGVVTGYRQANSQRHVRADAVRFLQ